jgi:hypothetical protein
MTLLVVVCSTVSVVPGAVVVSTVVSVLVATTCARPPLTMTAAARKPAAKRAARAESFTALDTHTYCQIAEPPLRSGLERLCGVT